MIGMIGTQDMILFFVLMLLLFGAKKLPELARGMGKAMGEFKKVREEFEREITHAVNHAENEVVKEPAAIEPTAAVAPAVPSVPSVPAASVAAPATHEPHLS